MSRRREVLTAQKVWAASAGPPQCDQRDDSGLDSSSRVKDGFACNAYAYFGPPPPPRRPERSFIRVFVQKHLDPTCLTRLVIRLSLDPLGKRYTRAFPLRQDEALLIGRICLCIVFGPAISARALDSISRVAISSRRTLLVLHNDQHEPSPKAT